MAEHEAPVPPPASGAPIAGDADDEHLRLLAVFHSVLAVIAGLFALFPVVHLLVGLTVLAGGFGASDPKEALAGRMMGCFFVGIAGMWMLFGAALAAGLALAGGYLRQRRNYTFCLVVAGLACAFTPLGTVLGVFTLIVLLRDSVRAKFGRPPFRTTPGP